MEKRSLNLISGGAPELEERRYRLGKLTLVSQHWDERGCGERKSQARSWVVVEGKIDGSPTCSRAHTSRPVGDPSTYNCGRLLPVKVGPRRGCRAGPALQAPR